MLASRVMSQESSNLSQMSKPDPRQGSFFLLSNVVSRRRGKLFASKGLELQDVIPHIILPIAKWNVFALNHPRKIWGRGASAQPMKIKTCLTHGSWPKKQGSSRSSSHWPWLSLLATGHGCRGFIMCYMLKKSYDNISLMICFRRI